MKITIEQVSAAIRLSWTVAHKADTHTTWMRSWNAIFDELDGMWNLVLEIGEIEDTEEIRDDITLLKRIAHINCYSFKARMAA